MAEVSQKCEAFFRNMTACTAGSKDNEFFVAQVFQNDSQAVLRKAAAGLIQCFCQSAAAQRVFLQKGENGGEFVFFCFAKGDWRVAAACRVWLLTAAAELFVKLIRKVLYAQWAGADADHVFNTVSELTDVSRPVIR